MLTNSCVAIDSACTFPSEAVRNLEVIREHLVPTRNPIVQITELNSTSLNTGHLGFYCKSTGVKAH